MEFLLDSLIILLSSILLVYGIRMFIDSTSKLAHAFHISGYTISFLLVALATSLPETIVGITAALDNNSILAYSNTIGSNIALLTLIVGLPGLLNAGIKTRSIFKSKDIYFTITFSLCAMVMSFDQRIGKIDGIILLSLYVVYAVEVLRRSTPLQRIIENLEHINVWKQFVLFAVSLGIVILGSEGIVRAALILSSRAGVNIGFIGLTLTAIGTSLPEIAFSIASIKKHREEDVMGDVIGSVVANITLVLGLTSIISPIQITNYNLSLSSNFFLILVLTAFLIFSKTKGRLDKAESALLAFFYLLFIGFEYFILL